MVTISKKYKVSNRLKEYNILYNVLNVYILYFASFISTPILVKKYFGFSIL